MGIPLLAGGYVAKFHRWHDVHPDAGPAAVAPWTAVPAELRTPGARWNHTVAAEERRIVTNAPPFASEDSLGIYIETTIHNPFLHSAAAITCDEPALADPMRSPVSTYFYKIHGLIGRWGQNWHRPAQIASLARPEGGAAGQLAGISDRLRAMDQHMGALAMASGQKKPA